jgi:mannitol 2-dehydrogenase
VGVVHVGVGGFHRAHEAMFHDRLLLDPALHGWGICGVGLLPADARMRDVLDAQGGLYVRMEKHGDGRRSASVIGSIVSYRFAPDDRDSAIEAMAARTTRIVSLTITEGAYRIDPTSGVFDAGGLETGDEPATVFGIVIEALRRRKEREIPPFTLLSCDNLQGNGDVCRRAFSGFARRKDPAFADWMEQMVAFPNSMVDCITPGTTDADRLEVRERFGIEDAWPVVCEPFAQWVLEDTFSDGRPPYERVGVQLVSDVAPYELMKLRLLNGSHQALCYLAYLSGYRLVHEAAQDINFVRFLVGYMQHEVRPTLLPLPGIDLDGYIATLLERFANSQIADPISRICADTSDRIPRFVLPVIRRQLELGGAIARAAAVVAAWARYAEGFGEDGEPITIVDRLRDDLVARARCRAGTPDAFISNRAVFGDLVDDERFLDSYRDARTLLRAHGARATVATLG